MITVGVSFSKNIDRIKSREKAFTAACLPVALRARFLLAVALTRPDEIIPGSTGALDRDQTIGRSLASLSKNIST
jgi:hypothetical protein